jgi:hypothetical protein
MRETTEHRRGPRGNSTGACRGDAPLSRTQASGRCAARALSTGCGRLAVGAGGPGGMLWQSPQRARGSASGSPASGANENEAAPRPFGQLRTTFPLPLGKIMGHALLADFPRRHNRMLTRGVRTGANVRSSRQPMTRRLAGGLCAQGKACGHLPGGLGTAAGMMTTMVPRCVG